ncbi:MAG: PH domain-containing protein [Micromonosporaceae bacterium]|nr:PH domain-containing protein [Micromonosporaceae bacterium]
MTQTPDVVRARPRRAAAVCWIAAIAVVVVFSVVATGLRGGTEGGGVFGAADQVAMVGLGLLGALGILSFTRPRAEADKNGIRVRNVVGSYDLPWDVVRAVRFGRGAPWASLELVDDDVVAVMAIQAADKEHAVEAVRQVRRLLADHQGSVGAG